MSEFSDSYHLAASDRGEAVALLERAGRPGWVVAEGGGWVTFVVGTDFSSAADEAVVAANTGVLLHYANAEDHGCGFELFDGPTRTDGVVLLWEESVRFDPALADEDRVLSALASVVPRDRAALAVHHILDVKDRDDVHDEHLVNVGHRFAQTLGLPAYEWLSGHYIELGDSHYATDAIEVGLDSAVAVAWVRVDELDDEYGIASEFRPPEVEVPIGDGLGEMASAHGDTWAWGYHARLHGVDAEAVTDELVDRARASGYVVELIPVATHGASQSQFRHFSIWRGHGTDVQALVDRRGRLTTVNLASPVVAQGYRAND